MAIFILELYSFHHSRQMGSQAVLLLNLFRECLTLPVFTVSQDHPRFARREGAEPGQQVGLAGMGTEAAERMNLCVYGHLFTVNADLFGPLYKPASERLVTL